MGLGLRIGLMQDAGAIGASEVAWIEGRVAQR